MSIRVLKPGLLSTVQDGGRHGHAALGVGHSGAMDRPAWRLANALVGNADDAAAFEATLLGPVLRFDAATRIALCGADVDARLDDEPMPSWCAVDVRAGAALDASRFRRGARAYLAVAGGLRAPSVLGSVSSDIHAGLGAPALRAGDVIGIDICAEAAAPGPRRAWSLDPRPWFDAHAKQPLRLVHGSHFEMLDPLSRAALFETSFRIDDRSNRVGIRLHGDPLRLSHTLELVSEPVTFGTMQLPPDGQPIVLMVEHPSTGGYPRIGQVAAVDLPRLAQRRPGDGVRFATVTLDDAFARYRAQQRELDSLVAAIHERNLR